MNENHNGKFGFSLALFDIDNFKSVNDNYGHPVGDYVLKEMVNIINSCIREEDCLARWGGEEFLLFLPYTSKDQANTIVDAIRKTIAAHTFKSDEEKFKLTITCGLSEFIHGESYKAIFKRIDDGLYNGKNSGKNKIVVM